MPTKQLNRLDRLAGDGKNSGGGLPLPPLFQTVVAELVDQGERTIADLVSPVQKAVPKPERVLVLYPQDGYVGLITDVLEQLKSKGLADYVDGVWKIGDKYQEGKTRTVIPERLGKNHALTVTVYSKEERDRRSAATRDDRELRAMYNDLRNERTFSVRAAFSSGRAKRMELKLHPLSRAIPQMSEQEFMDLGYDIKEHGVKVPIVLFDGQVLDGRHRVAVAAALHTPVRVDQFDGDEAAAREHVVSLNLQRRNLNIPQRALIVQQLFLPQAESEARERQRERMDLGGTSPPTGGNVDQPDIEATQAAAARSHGLASARTLQRMQPVREALETQERIRRGEITSATQARREALAELGREAPADIPAMTPRSGYMSMGQALYEINNTNVVLWDEIRGRTSIEQYVSRLQKLTDGLAETARTINRWADRDAPTPASP